MVLLCLVLGLGYGKEAMLLAASRSSHEVSHVVNRYAEEDLPLLGRDVALRVAAEVRTNPNAVIVFSTGQEIEGIYQRLQELFVKDPSLDLSKASFFLMDEYEGLGASHPLSNWYFFNVHFLSPLQKIDASRAPCQDQCFYPGQTKTGVTVDEAFWGQFLLSKGLPGPDLMVLTLGGAYPVREQLGTVCIKGGRMGAIEPDLRPDQKIVRVRLSDHRKSEIAHRYKALGRLIDRHEMPAFNGKSLDLPDAAWTFTPMSCAKAKSILVVATGEDKGPVIASVLESDPSSRVPASFLSRLTQVSWYLDTGAAAQLSATAWQDGVLREEDMIEALCHESMTCRGAPLIVKSQFPEKTVSFDKDLLQITHENFKTQLASCLITASWPEGKRILVLSPHPDDDVISMGAALMRLQQRKNLIHVLYAVTGANAVRDTLPTYADAYLQVSAFLPNDDEKNKKIAAKALVREWEAVDATSHLGIPSQNLIFFKADYYERRGIPGLSPFSAGDLSRIKILLKDLAPEIIFFAAENDPNGAHGLSTQLLATALDELVQNKDLAPPILYGYRGAYNEWPLTHPSSLLIVPYDKELQDDKIKAIKRHASQLDPLYPSFDPRPFFQRAKDRNRSSCLQMSSLLGYPIIDPVTGQRAEGVEVFKRKDIQAFLAQYM